MKNTSLHSIVGACTGLCIGLFSLAHAQVTVINIGINQPAALLAHAGNDISLCGPQNVVLGGSPAASGGTGAFNYQWSPSTGLSSPTDPNPSVTPSVTTTYTLSVTDQRNCSASDDITVTLGAAPTAAFSSTINSLSVAFSNLSTGASAYLWDFGDGATSTFANPSHTYPTFGSYNVCLIASSGPGCADTLCQAVDLLVGVKPSMDVDRVELYPNPFSQQAQLNFFLKNAASVQLEAFDLTGKRLAVLRNEDMGAGQQAIQIHTGDHGLPTGAYLLRLTVNGVSMSIRAVLMN